MVQPCGGTALALAVFLLPLSGLILGAPAIPCLPATQSAVGYTPHQPGMPNNCRKGKQAGREALSSRTKRARGIRGRPGQPQPIRCRVEGCHEPLTPGYHKVGCRRGDCEQCVACGFRFPAAAHVYRLWIALCLVRRKVSGAAGVETWLLRPPGPPFTAMPLQPSSV